MARDAFDEAIADLDHIDDETLNRFVRDDMGDQTIKT